MVDKMAHTYVIVGHTDDNTHRWTQHFNISASISTVG